MFYPQTGYVEQDGENWWKIICRGIHSLLNSSIKPQEIAAIGVAGTSWACIPVDRQGRLLRPVMLWLDPGQRSKRTG